MKKRFAKFSKGVIFGTCFLLFSKSVLAYIDIGTGSMLLGSIGPIIGLILAAIGAFFLKRFINPVKSLFHKHKVLSTVMVSAVVIILIVLLFSLF